jgi:hypothetical protein
MKVTIDVKTSVVSVDGVARAVVFPVEYAALATIHYDTETAVGLGESVGGFTIGSILAVSLSMWHAACPTAEDIWVLIKAKRTAINAGGLNAAGYWYHTDPESLAQYSIMYAAIAVNSLPDSYVFSTMWKTMSGKFRPMNASRLKSIITIGMANAAANFANAERHKALLFASPRPAQYDYSTGWAKVYENSIL